MRSRRALLYMPGDDRRKIEKATTLGVDCICMDLEDGTALNKKAEAREVIAQAMRELDFGKSERCIRINSVGSGLEYDDLAAALAAGPDTIVLPKVESAEQVQWVSGEIESTSCPMACRWAASACWRDWKPPKASQPERDRRRGQAPRSAHLRRGRFRRQHRRDALPGSDRAAVCPTGSGHDLRGLRNPGHRHRLHRLP